MLKIELLNNVKEHKPQKRYYRITDNFLFLFVISFDKMTHVPFFTYIYIHLHIQLQVWSSGNTFATTPLRIFATLQRTESTEPIAVQYDKSFENKYKLECVSGMAILRYICGQIACLCAIATVTFMAPLTYYELYSFKSTYFWRKTILPLFITSECKNTLM